MAGASKKHAQAGKQPQGSSQGSSSASRDPTQRSTKSIPRLDGNRDPSVLVPVDYTRPTDLKNISEFLGIGGWYAARGVSTNTLLSQPAYACTFPNKHSQLPHLRMQTGFSPLFREAETLDACKKKPLSLFLLSYSHYYPFIFDHFPHLQHSALVHHLYHSLSPIPSS
jgi:hypothetical protein